MLNSTFKTFLKFHCKRLEMGWISTRAWVDQKTMNLKMRVSFLRRLVHVRWYRGSPPLTRFSLTRIPFSRFWLMYAQVGDFCVSRGHPTVPLTQISRNAVFFKSQNPRKAGTLCTIFWMLFWDDITIFLDEN